jgi:YidC/Oxa1 family membrane protein insertase
MSFLSPAVLPVYHVVAGLSAVLVPLLGGGGPAAAVVLFTAAVRLCLYPLNRAQARAQASSQKARAALAPAVRRLERKYKHDPRRAQRETFELYRAHGVPLAPGMLHGLAQIPVFVVVYRMFESPSIGGHPNSLLGGRLFGVGLGTRLTDVLRAPLVPAHVAVFALLLAAVAAIATWSSIRIRRTAAGDGVGVGVGGVGVGGGVGGGGSGSAGSGGVTRLMALLPFGTLVTAAILPLATGLYLATTTLWTVVERRRLQAVGGSDTPNVPSAPAKA